MARAAIGELIARNVAAIVRPPKVESHEVQILTAPQIAETLARLEGRALYPIAVTATWYGDAAR